MSPTPAYGPLEYWRAGYSAPRTRLRQVYPRRRRGVDVFAAVLVTTSASSTATSTMSTSASTTRSTTTATVPPPQPPFEFDEDEAEPVIGGTSERSREIFLRMLRLNNAGDYADNPIVTGVRFTARLHKHGEEEEFLKCWTTVAGEIVADVTTRCVVSDEEVEVDLEVGEDLTPGFPAVLNIIHFTTSYGHVKGGIFCADLPRASVLLDGYNADDEARPAILRITE